MIIDNLTLKKICIAEGFFDPHVLWKFVSPWTKKRLGKMLDAIKEKHSDHSAMLEYETVKLIKGMFEENARRSKNSFILLEMAKNRKMLTPSVYDRLGKSMGIEKFSDETQTFLDNGNNESVDIFQKLKGQTTPEIDNELPVAAETKINNIKTGNNKEIK